MEAGCLKSYSLAYEVNETDQSNLLSRTNHLQDILSIYFNCCGHDPLWAVCARKYIQSVSEYDKLLLVGPQAEIPAEGKIDS
jgi:hypothetical protein